MAKQADQQQRLRAYRPKRWWTWLASILGRTTLLSDNTLQPKSWEVREEAVLIFFDPKQAKYRKAVEEGTYTIALTFWFTGAIALTNADSNFEYFGGSIILVTGILIFGRAIFQVGKQPESKPSIVLSLESLQLPGTGEFMWANITNIAFKERNRRIKVLLIQLSNGTIVEHQVRAYNSDSLGYSVGGDAYKLRQLIYTYWTSANSLELKPLEEPAIKKLPQKNELKA